MSGFYRIVSILAYASLMISSIAYSSDTEIKRMFASTANGDIYAPPIVQFYKDGTRFPSCKIVSKSGKELDLIIIDEEEVSGYSNCSKIYQPKTIKINGENYAIYKFTEEETRGSFIKHFAVLRINEDNFHECKNTQELDEKIKIFGPQKSLATYGCK